MVPRASDPAHSNPPIHTRTTGGRVSGYGRSAGKYAGRLAAGGDVGLFECHQPDAGSNSRPEWRTSTWCAHGIAIITLHEEVIEIRLPSLGCQ